MSQPRTIIEKLWDSHVVAEQPGAPTLLYIDLHLVHEVTSPQAFSGLRERGLKVRRPDLTFATVDHSIPTTPRAADRRPDRRDAGRAARDELQGVRHSLLRLPERHSRASCTSSDRSTGSRSPA